MPSIDELSAREHEQVQDYVRDIVRQFDHPEAVRALTAVVGIGRVFASALWDGSNGLHPERVTQCRIDAQVWADFGTAIEEHCKMAKR